MKDSCSLKIYFNQLSTVFKWSYQRFSSNWPHRRVRDAVLCVPDVDCTRAREWRRLLLHGANQLDESLVLSKQTEHELECDCIQRHRPRRVRDVLVCRERRHCLLLGPVLCCYGEHHDDCQQCVALHKQSPAYLSVARTLRI